MDGEDSGLAYEAKCKNLPWHVSNPTIAVYTLLETCFMSDKQPPFPSLPFADFGKLVPGFDFLQNLSRQAGVGSEPAAAPAIPGFPGMPASMGNWIAPTLNTEDLDRRIQELKTVQFWLDQNATALRATIQAMEVQKMTLAALGTMNVNFNEMANAFQAKPAAVAAAVKPGGRSKPAAKVFAGLEIPPTQYAAQTPPASAPLAESASTTPPAGLVDPLQWWGALTQQFQTIAAGAIKEAAQKTAPDLAADLAANAASEPLVESPPLEKKMQPAVSTPTAAASPAASRKKSAAAPSNNIEDSTRPLSTPKA